MKGKHTGDLQAVLVLILLIFPNVTETSNQKFSLKEKVSLRTPAVWNVSRVIK